MKQLYRSIIYVGKKRVKLGLGFVSDKGYTDPFAAISHELAVADIGRRDLTEVVNGLLESNNYKIQSWVKPDGFRLRDVVYYTKG